MANLIVLLIVLGCGAYQFFKGTIVRAVATIIITLAAAAVAFGFFEPLSSFFISKGSSSRYPALVPWAQPLCFILLFVVAFALLQTGVMQLTRVKVDFGLWPERIGRVLAGVVLGLILSGLLLTAAVMAPLPNAYPYERFDNRGTNPDAPAGVLFSPDGLVTGWFSLLSKGSFRAIHKPRSFAALHPAFLDQVFLNRLNKSPEIPLVTSSDSIETPAKAGIWNAPDDIKDSEDKPIPPKTGHNLMLVRVGIRKRAMKDAASFTLSQLRLICKTRDDASDPLAGNAKNAYPIGYLTAPNNIQRKGLADPIRLDRADFDENANQRWIDFAFYVPSGSVPVLVQFKLNNAATLSAPAADDQIPTPIPFVERRESKSQQTRPEGDPGRDQKRDSSGSSGRRPLSNVSKSIVGDGFDNN